MMKKYASMLSVAILGALFLTAPGCRSRTKPNVTPPPTATVTDTAPEIEPPVPPPSDPVVQEPEDFVDREPQAEDLPSDAEALNQLAHSRGWIRDVFFNYDEASLDAVAQEAISTTAAWLKAHPEYNVIVEGHCDERGTEQYNLALGDRRANSVRDQLGILGVDTARIRAVSYGEEKPFDEASNDAAWAKNRRAHFVLVTR